MKKLMIFFVLASVALTSCDFLFDATTSGKAAAEAKELGEITSFTVVAYKDSSGDLIVTDGEFGNQPYTTTIDSENNTIQVVLGLGAFPNRGNFMDEVTVTYSLTKGSTGSIAQMTEVIDLTSTVTFTVTSGDGELTESYDVSTVTADAFFLDGITIQNYDGVQRHGTAPTVDIGNATHTSEHLYINTNFDLDGAGDGQEFDVFATTTTIDGGGADVTIPLTGAEVFENPSEDYGILIYIDFDGDDNNDDTDWDECIYQHSNNAGEGIPIPNLTNASTQTMTIDMTGSSGGAVTGGTGVSF